MGPLKIYILHGWAFSTEKWSPLINLLNKEGFRVVLPKIPGLTEKTDKIWTLDGYVDWLGEILKEEKNKVTLLGHSNGGRIAIKFAALNPDRLSNLILIDSAGIYHNGVGIRLKRTIFKTLASIGKKTTNSKLLRNILYKIAGEKDYQEADNNLRKTMVNLISEDLKPLLLKIKTKTLLIWGNRDNDTPLRDGKIMRELINNSNLKIIEGAKHSPQFTHPEIVVKLITEQLS